MFDLRDSVQRKAADGRYWRRTIDIKDLEAGAEVGENRCKHSTSLSSDEGYGRGLHKKFGKRANDY